MDKYKIFDDNLVLFNSILNDIKAAKQSVWIEIYRFGKDAMGEKFRMALEEKAKEGVEIKILVDAWGTGAETSFFEPLIRQGAEEIDTCELFELVYIDHIAGEIEIGMTDVVVLKPKA